jgi:hypothetical protein
MSAAGVSIFRDTDTVWHSSFPIVALPCSIPCLVAHVPK